MYNKKAVEYYEEGKILQQQGRLSDAAPMPFNKLPKLFENIRAGQSLHEGEQAFLPFEHNSNI